jgi:hypothetical protein
MKAVDDANALSYMSLGWLFCEHYLRLIMDDVSAFPVLLVGHQYLSPLANWPNYSIC